MAGAKQQSRRGFLKTASAVLGGCIAVVLSVPLLRYALYPLGRRVVRSANEPIDVGPSDAVVAGAVPLRVPIMAKQVRDAWSVVRDVPLGAAWLVRRTDGQLQAFSSVCPHLGCAVDFHSVSGDFQCPCHNSAFATDGRKRTGPAKRGLDSLVVAERDGRVFVTYRRFRGNVADRREV